MTCIAYKNGSLSADKAMIRYALPTPVTKIRKVRFGTSQVLCGYSGRITEADRFFTWVETGCVVEDWPFQKQEGEDGNDAGIGLAVTKTDAGDVTIRLFDNSPYGIEIERNFHAIGGDGLPAVCCMECGIDPVTAINAISKHSILTGQGVDTIYFD